MDTGPGHLPTTQAIFYLPWGAYSRPSHGMMPDIFIGESSMRIALSWRALSESASHLSLLEHLHRDHGHAILVLRECGSESHIEKEGISYQPVRTWGGWHPAIRILSGWTEALETFHPDVLLGLEEPYAVQSALFLRWARNHSIPFVFLSCQNIDRLLPYPFRRLESWVLSQAQGAWFLNREAEARARLRGFRGVGRVIPLGVDLDPEPPIRGEAPPAVETQRELKDFTVGYVGRLVPEKGVEDLIRACSLSGVRLLVAGEGPDHKRLATLAQELQVPVTWLGWIESTRIREVYSQMDILVLPSVTTPRWKEQFGRVLVEAMAHGVPVIGSSSGEIPNVMGDAGLLFPERDSGYLADCMKRILSDPVLRATLVDKGCLRVRSLYGWDRVAGQLNELILAMDYTHL